VFCSSSQISKIDTPHIEHSPNTDRLEKVMDELFETQKSEIIGDRLKLKIRPHKEFMNTSLPAINLKPTPEE
jgi:hypothetical protein